jgi:hypothetical protein
MIKTIDFSAHGNIQMRPSIAGTVCLSVAVPGLAVPIILTHYEAQQVALGMAECAKVAKGHADYYLKNQNLGA